MAVLYSNNASTTLSATITSSATSLAVASGKGALFPAITGSDYFYITLVNTAGAIEIMKVTARSTDTFTVVRGQDGTTAVGWAAGDRVELRFTKGMLDDIKGERMPVYGPSVGSAGRVMINMSGNPAWSDAAFTYDVILGQFRASNFRANTGDAAPTWNLNAILHAGNYTSYSPSLTGSGASGTWGISITGYGYGVSVLDTDRTIANRLPTSTPLSVRFDFANANAVGTGGNYAGVMTFSPWTGTTASTGDASYQLVFGSTAANGGGNPLLRLRKGIDSAWNSWVDVLTSANYSSYSPSLTGSGASGTWGISITGNAATATSAGSVSGLTLTSSANGINPDSVTQNQLGYNNSVSLFGQIDGGLYSSAYSSSWIHQIFGDFRTGQIAIRGKNNGAWQAWRTVLDSSNYTSYAAAASHTHSYLPLSGGTLSGNLLFANATSPNTYYLQFGDNSGWKFRYMTSVSGTPTERFGFTDQGNFSAVGSVTWGSGNAAAVMNSGNPRSLAIGFSGGNYGGASYGVNYTTTSGNHTYAFADIVSRWDAYDGLVVYAAPSGTVGAAVTWTNVLEARRSNASLIFKGNTVLDSSNYTNYVAGAGGGTYTGTNTVSRTTAGDAWNSTLTTTTTLADKITSRFTKTNTPPSGVQTNSIGGLAWNGKNYLGNSYEFATITGLVTSASALSSGAYALGYIDLTAMAYSSSLTVSSRLRIGNGSFSLFTSGDAQFLNITSGGIVPLSTYTPSVGSNTNPMGEAYFRQVRANNGWFENTKLLQSSQTLASGYNAMMAGPVTIDNGYTITISDGSTLTIV